MKNFSGVIAALFMALVMCAQSPSAVWAVDSVEAQKLLLPRITLSADSYVFKPGKPLVFSVHVFNPADYPVRLLESGVYDAKTGVVAPFFTLRLQDESGAVIKKQAGAIRFSGKEKFFVLDPGKTVSYTFDLSSWVGDELSAGKYNFVVGHVRGVAIADSSPVIFEVVSAPRAALIQKMKDAVVGLLRCKKAKDCGEFLASGGVWLETGAGGMTLYSSAFFPEFIEQMELPRSKKSLKKHVFYLPAYDAVFVGTLGDKGEIFSFKNEDDILKISRISDLL